MPFEIARTETRQVSATLALTTPQTPPPNTSPATSSTRRIVEFPAREPIARPDIALSPAQSVQDAAPADWRLNTQSLAPAATAAALVAAVIGGLLFTSRRRARASS